MKDNLTPTQFKIIDAVNSLPESQRKILILCDMKNLSPTEVCKMMNISKNRLKRLLIDARLNLQELLAEKL